jgi:hypothetical protein
LFPSFFKSNRPFDIFFKCLKQFGSPEAKSNSAGIESDGEAIDGLSLFGGNVFEAIAVVGDDIGVFDGSIGESLEAQLSEFRVIFLNSEQKDEEYPELWIEVLLFVAGLNGIYFTDDELIKIENLHIGFEVLVFIDLFL